VTASRRLAILCLWDLAFRSLEARDFSTVLDCMEALRLRGIYFGASAFGGSL
jgi:hypothetical protein